MEKPQVVIAGLDPAIYSLTRNEWMPGSSPGMTPSEQEAAMTTIWRRVLAMTVLSAALSLMALPQAFAQSVEQFYRGRTVTMLVGTAPGGINDISARLVVKYLGRFIPGNPAIVVQNNPGAGGLVTGNKLYNNAERDGSVLAKFERAVPQIQIQGDPNAQFDSTKFVWLGSLSSYANDAYLLLINADNPVKAVDDLRKPGVKLNLGADNSASSNLIFAVIAKEILGLNINVIRGYTGAANLFLAMQSRELDGQFVGLSSVKSGQRDLWNKGAFRPLMAFGRTTRHPDFPDIPIEREMTKDKEALSLIEFAELPFFMALPFAAPPGIPADRAKALQAAFMTMCRDKEFVAEAEKIGIDMSPIDGDRILKMLAATAATPKEVIARYTSIAAEKK
jgi:tripartite-type tricarboxylate transporter receptor subunit TctC